MKPPPSPAVEAAFKLVDFVQGIPDGDEDHVCDACESDDMACVSGYVVEEIHDLARRAAELRDLER